MTLSRDADGWLLVCKVQTRSKVTGFGEVRNGEAIVKLHAPPIDGRANAALCEFIAAAFAVPRSNVSIMRGAHSHHKVLRIAGVTELPKALQWLDTARTA